MKKVLLIIITLTFFLNGYSNCYATSGDTEIKKIELTPSVTPIEQDSENKKNYRVAVANQTTSVDIKVEPNNPRTSVSIDGNSALDIGTNKVEVILTAENGNTEKYIIYVRRLSKEIADTRIEPNIQENEKEFVKPSDNIEQATETKNDKDINDYKNDEDIIDNKSDENIETNETENSVEGTKSEWVSNERSNTNIRNIIKAIIVIVALVAISCFIFIKKNRRKTKH